MTHPELADALLRAHQLVKTWYRFVPEINSPYFTEFVSKMFEIIIYISQQDAKKIKISMENTALPHARFLPESGHYVINIPSMLLTEQFILKEIEGLEPKHTLNKYYLICLLNHIIIHESLHTRMFDIDGFNRVILIDDCFTKKFSIKTRPAFSVMYNGNVLEKMKTMYYFLNFKKAAGAFVNILNDIRIESAFINSGHHATQFVEVAEEIRHPEYKFREFREPTAPEEFFQYLSWFRNPFLQIPANLPSTVDVYEMMETIETLRKGTFSSTMTESAIMDVSIRFALQFDYTSTSSEFDSMCSKMCGNGSGDVDLIESLDEAKEGLDPQSMRELYRKGEAIIQKWHLTQTGKRLFEEVPVVHDISNIRNRGENAPSFTEKYVNDNLFKGFATLLDQLRTKNLVEDYTYQSNRGKIRRSLLTNLFTGGKIREEKWLKIDKEKDDDFSVLFLVDMSGSMIGDRLIYTCLSGAYNAAVSCVRAGIPTSLWGHTGEHSCHLYHMGTSGVEWKHKMRGNFTDGLFNGFAQRFANNYDSDAINHVAKLFPSNKGKVLIVFSDGQPHACRDQFTNAIEEVKYVVDKLRKKQEMVIFGVALTEDVIPTNHRIYGEQYTVIGTNKVNLSNSLKKIIQKVQGEN